MLNFNQFNSKKEKKDYEIVKSRSGLPMFVLPLPDELNNLTSDDVEDREVEVVIDEPVKKTRSIPQQVQRVCDYITRHF